MGPITTFRPATAADIAACAQIVARAKPHEWVDFEYTTPAEMQAFDASLSTADAMVARIVAEQSGAIVGVGMHFRVPWTARAHHHWGVVRVDAAFRRQGIGSRLWGQIRGMVCDAGGRSLAVEVRSSAAHTLVTCARVGLREAFRSVEYRADLRGFEPHPFDYALEKAIAHGITIQSLPELQLHDPHWLTKLHSLYIMLSRDVPIPERATISPAGLAEFVGSMPSALPDACFVAVDPNGDYAGVSFMHRTPGELVLIQKLTGVLAAYRGKNIALALKLHTMIYARKHGYRVISTWIETNNKAMNALAVRLGFVAQPSGIVVLEDILGKNMAS